ncbi:peptidase [Streptomyces sp. NPDC006733]|uniref:trypsin-like serine peptidase n=1 Tax=Streptomyces sp. NPDC006733 TaxID=3155460 RepID=UPI0033EADD80
MRRPRHALAGILLSAGALIAASLQVTAAQAAPAPVTAGPAASVHTGAATAAAQQRVGAFWTADRMRAAVPLDLLPVTAGALRAPVDRGRETVVAPTRASSATPRAATPASVAGPMAFPNAGGPWSGGGAIVTTSGRVFFTFQGRNASCSGDAVTSQNASLVITAGHCVKYQGSWHTNWTFVPGYHDGQAPYGTWTAAKTLATSQWASSESMNYDVGAAVVNPLNGRRLTEVVGAQGLKFNGGYNQAMYAFGFPAAAPYDGTRLDYCSGNTSKDFLLTTDHGMSCNMTGGSSGGPWFSSFDEATGTGLQTSVNSFGYTFLPNRMFGPYFGTVVQTFYNQAQAS